MTKNILAEKFNLVLRGKGGFTMAACILSVLIIPIYIHLLPPVMCLWFVLWIFEYRQDPGRKQFIYNKAATLFMLFVLFYLWQVSGLILADSLGTGVERLVKRLSFIIFPAVLFYPGQAIKDNIKQIIRLFAIGTFLYLVYCFIHALSLSLIIKNNSLIFNPHPAEYPWENHFFAERLSQPIHPSYLAMYILISIIIVLESFFDKDLTAWKKGLLAIVSVIFIVALYLLSARSGILAGIIVIPAYCIFRFFNKISKWILVPALVLLIGVLAIGARKNTRVHNMILSMSDQKIDETFKTDARLLIWQSAIGVIRKNVLLGVGTGDASNALTEEFLSRGYREGFYSNLNAHNQFLEILLENGLIGLIIFLTIFGYMIHIAVNQRNLLLGLYVISVAIFFMFETMMNRISGISFFSLFSFLLIWNKSEKSVN